MASTIQVPGQYGYVLIVASSTFFINTFHVLLTSKSRKASGIKYPVAYATEEQAAKDPKAMTFNCAQRAHANFTENHTSALGALLIAGLGFPKAASIAGAGWAVSRVVYGLGYTSGAGPKGRALGSLGSFAFDFALKCMATYTAVSMVLDS